MIIHYREYFVKEYVRADRTGMSGDLYFTPCHCEALSRRGNLIYFP